MGKRYIVKQYEIERQRNADLAARYAAMTERELVAVLETVARDEWEMRHNANAHEAAWERIAVRSELARTELANRRQSVAA